MNGGRGNYPWTRVEKGMSNGAREVAHGQPHASNSEFSVGRTGSWPPSNNTWKDSDGWGENQKNGGQAAKWKDRGRGELIDIVESNFIDDGAPDSGVKFC